MADGTGQWSKVVEREKTTLLLPSHTLMLFFLPVSQL